MRKTIILRGTKWACVSRMSFFLFVLVAFFLAFIVLVLNFDGFYTEREERIARKMIELSEHMNYLKHLDKEKQKSLIDLENRYKLLFSQLDEKRFFDANISLDDLRSLKNRFKSVKYDSNKFNLASQQEEESSSDGINNQSINKLFMTSSINDDSAGDLSLPSIYDHMPHLLLTSESLTPALRVAAAAGQRRRRNKNVEFTVGIPTVKRNKTSYLATTLRSLIDNLTPETRDQILIVVFIGEMGVTKFAKEQVKSLRAEFQNVIDEGLLEIIIPDPSFYPPDLDRIEPTLGDSPDRMKWRTKQNLDFAYLMMYCQNRGTFYVQLEDDVITKPNYLQTIRDFISSQQQGDKWYMLEFSTLGFIGKLFRSRDLPQIIDFISMFYRLKPVDWLLHLIFMVRYCHLEKFGKECQKVVNERRIRLKPSLFQHIGVHSSLTGKVQKLKEKDFGKQPLHKPHKDNPAALVATSLKAYQKFTLDDAYRGQSFFWGLVPQPGDWATFNFTPPIRLDGFTLRSGNAEHPDDMFYNTSVELLPATTNHRRVGAELSGENYPITDDGYHVVGWFSETGLVQMEKLNFTTPIASLRLVVHAESDNWVILSEIWIKGRS